MLELKVAGYSYGDIGKLYNISRQRVHQLISGYGRNLKRLNRHNGNYWKRHNMILNRDNHICQKCGSNEKPIVHHIDGDDNNNELANLITLCAKCHLNLHRPNGIGKKGGEATYAGNASMPKPGQFRNRGNKRNGRGGASAGE